jgi:hypothetical protein
MNLRGRRLRILILLRFYLLNIRVKNLTKSQRANTANTANYPYMYDTKDCYFLFLYKALPLWNKNNNNNPYNNCNKGYNNTYNNQQPSKDLIYRRDQLDENIDVLYSKTLVSKELPKSLNNSMDLDLDFKNLDNINFEDI